MKNLKQLLGVFFLSISFIVVSVQATDNIYKIDTNGSQDSPKPLADIYEQDRINVVPETTVNYLSLKPSSTVWGLLGKQALAIGQGMLPFGGNGVDSTFYGVVEADVGMKRATGYSAGFGGGYRKIFNNSYLVGGYLLADWNRSPLSHNFWIGNLGVEVLNYNWDFRVNAYIPVSKKYWLGDTKTGAYEETTTGFDAEIGRVLPIPKTQGLKLFVGGYRFNMNKTHNVAGVEARIVYPVTRYLTLEARDSYDSVRFNIGMVGLRFTIGGYNNENKENLGIAGRMSDAIEHNFANFANCNTSVVNKKLP